MSNSFGFGGVNTCLVLESGKGNLNSKYMWALEKNLKVKKSVIYYAFLSLEIV